jgi:hypothetical protein
MSIRDAVRIEPRQYVAGHAANNPFFSPDPVEAAA